MFDQLYPLFSVVSFLGFVLVLVPLPWHLQAWNSGTCFYIMWSALSCLNQFINSVVWADDMINKAPVWCDISIRITLAASVGVPAASLCINRRLYHIASVKSVSVTVAEKKRGILIDTFICVLFPLVYTALQYVVQGHRFNIYEQIGCAPALYNSIPMYFLSTMWPPLIGVISAIYGFLSLRAFTRRRAAFAELLSSHNSLTTSRYLRLMALSATDILLTTPLGIFSIIINATISPVQPWISWADTHSNFGRVGQLPALFWRYDRIFAIAIEFTRWTAPITALLFFAFFGFAVEARKNYAHALRVVVAAFWRVAARLGVRRPSSGFFAAQSSARGIGYTKPSPVKGLPAAAVEEISLPAYSSAGATGSFTESIGSVADIKRAPSFATSPTPRFVEGLAHGDEEKALPLTPRSSSYVEVDTPVTATSFASTATQFVVPLHVGWNTQPYPADGESAADTESTRFSPTSAASRFSYPQT